MQSSQQIEQEINVARAQLIGGENAKIAAGVGIGTAVALAIAALVIAIIAYTYYMDLESRVVQTNVSLDELLKENKTDTPQEVKEQANLIANGSGTGNLNALDAATLEGNIDEAAPADILAGIDQAERMSVGGRYYSEFDDILRGM